MKVFLVLIALLNSTAFAQTSVDSSKIVKVMSFNIYGGATTQKDYDLDKIADLIKDTDPDFVALQEVDFKTKRGKGYDFATELGWRTGMTPLFARAMFYNGGEYGSGILSRYSYLESRNIPLPSSPENEARTAVEAITTIASGDTISLVNTHLDHLADSQDRINQVQKINKLFLSGKHPTILAGDLNDIPGSEAVQILEQHWTSTYNRENPEATFPSDSATKKIDYVMVYPGDRWEILETEVICDEIASDHCAYLVTLFLLD